jgi:hypothetical protein
MKSAEKSTNQSAAEQLQFGAPKRSLSCLWAKNIVKISGAHSRI